jgi:hypothetical protein
MLAEWFPTRPGEGAEAPLADELPGAQTAMVIAPRAVRTPTRGHVEWFGVEPAPSQLGPREEPAGAGGDARLIDTGAPGAAARRRGPRVRARRLAMFAAACGMAAAIAWIAHCNGERAVMPAPPPPAVPASPAQLSQLATPPGPPPTACPRVGAATASPRAPCPLCVDTRTRAAPVPQVPTGPSVAPAPETIAAAAPRELLRVVPPLPPLTPPDEARMRPDLEARVWAARGSVDEIRMLKAICSRMGDHVCRDRAYELLKNRPPEDSP